MKPIYARVAVVMFLFSGVLSAQQINASGDNEFLLKAFQSRMIATNEAKTASKKATSPAIRQFAKQLIKEEKYAVCWCEAIGCRTQYYFSKKHQLH